MIPAWSPPGTAIQWFQQAHSGSGRSSGSLMRMSRSIAAVSARDRAASPPSSASTVNARARWRPAPRSRTRRSSGITCSPPVRIRVSWACLATSWSGSPSSGTRAAADRLTAAVLDPTDCLTAHERHGMGEGRGVTVENGHTEPGEREADSLAGLLGGRGDEPLEQTFEPRVPDLPEYGGDRPPVHRRLRVHHLPHQLLHPDGAERHQRGCCCIVPVRPAEVPYQIGVHHEPLQQCRVRPCAGHPPEKAGPTSSPPCGAGSRPPCWTIAKVRLDRWKGPFADSYGEDELPQEGVGYSDTVEHLATLAVCRIPSRDTCK